GVHERAAARRCDLVCGDGTDGGGTRGADGGERRGRTGQRGRRGRRGRPAGRRRRRDRPGSALRRLRAGRAPGTAGRGGRPAGGGPGRRGPVPADRRGAAGHRRTRGGGRLVTQAVRVLLADDEHLIRGALAALLALEDDLRVVAEAATGPEALAMARAHTPDVAVLDLQMPGADGVKVATSMRTEVPDGRVLFVTAHGRPGHLKRAHAAGVGGCFRKTVSAQRLAESIRTVHAGHRYVDSELAGVAIAVGGSP